MGQNILKMDRRWDLRRNHRVCQLLETHPTMTRMEALRQANREMRARPRAKAKRK